MLRIVLFFVAFALQMGLDFKHSGGQMSTISSLSFQANEFKTVNSAFRSLEFSDKAIESIWKLVAVILHLGNLTFTESEAGNGQNGHVSQSLAPK